MSKASDHADDPDSPDSSSSSSEDESETGSGSPSNLKKDETSNTPIKDDQPLSDTNRLSSQVVDTPLSPPFNTSQDENLIEESASQNVTKEKLSDTKLNDSLSDISDLQDSFQNQTISEDKDKEIEEGNLDDGCLTSIQNESESERKRRSDEGLELRDDQLDFEEEKESGEEDAGKEEERGAVSPVSPVEPPEDKEDGEISEEEDEDAALRQEPKQVCRFFNKGQCTWGSNCRFLHPGVSDKGNYNMFAPQKSQPQVPEKEDAPEKEAEVTPKAAEDRAREIRRFAPEPTVFESAWERGLRYAKEMVKRASKRRETDADFEEKRFNLSLGQSELDRENDYYTRPASPVYKPVDEIIGVLDPYERQAIRHFRGGHFENLEVRYNVDPNFPGGGANISRSRRDKFEREVTERIPKKRVPPPHPNLQDPNRVQERRYPRPRGYKEERAPDPPPMVGTKAGPEVWADPWARNRDGAARGGSGRKVTSRRSYSTGSSSGSSRSSRSRSSSYSSYSGSGSRSRGSRSRSRSGSRSSSSSRSITPPVHPRQRQQQLRGGPRGRGRGGPRGLYTNASVPRTHPNHPNNQNIPPGVVVSNRPIHNGRGGYHGNRVPGVPTGGLPGDTEDVKDPRMLLGIQPKREPIRNYPDEIPLRNAGNTMRGPLVQPKVEPNTGVPNLPPGVTLSRKLDPRLDGLPKERLPVYGAPPKDPRPMATSLQVDAKGSITDMFGRNVPRKDIPPRKIPTPPPARRRRKYSHSPSGSESGSDSGSGSGSGSSSSRSRSRSRSGSGSTSRSSSSSSSSSGGSTQTREKKVRKIPGTVSYGDAGRKVVPDAPKVLSKPQVKMTVKRPAPGTTKPAEVQTLNDEDSGESDTDPRILKRRKLANADPLPISSKPRTAAPAPPPVAAPKPLPLPSMSARPAAAAAAAAKKSRSGCCSRGCQKTICCKTRRIIETIESR